MDPADRVALFLHKGADWGALPTPVRAPGGGAGTGLPTPYAGGDRGYDTQDRVKDIRAQRMTPHVARKKKHSAIDGRTTRHAGYGVSLRLRKRGGGGLRPDERPVGGLRRTRYRGVDRTGLAGYLVATAYNLVRMANLIPESETAPVPVRVTRRGLCAPSSGSRGPAGPMPPRAWGPHRGFQGSSDHRATPTSASLVVADVIPNPFFSSLLGSALKSTHPQ